MKGTARRGEQFEEASNCFLSIAGCERPENYLYNPHFNGKYRNPDDSGLPIGPIFKDRIPTFQDKLTFPSSRVKNPDLSGTDYRSHIQGSRTPTLRENPTVPSSRAKNANVSGQTMGPFSNGQESRRCGTAYHRSHLQG